MKIFRKIIVGSKIYWILVCLLLMINVGWSQTTQPITIETAVKSNPETAEDMQTKFLEKVYGYMDTTGDVINKAANKTSDFVSEQTPLICQDIIRYGIAKYSIYIFFDIVIIIIASIVIFKIIKIYRNIKHIEEGDFIGCFMAFIIPAIALVFCTINLIASALNLSMAIFAPRLYILQQIMEIIKSLKS